MASTLGQAIFRNHRSSQLALLLTLACALPALAARQGRVVSFRNFGGLNDSLVSTGIADNESPSLQNVRFELGALRKREGFDEVGGTSNVTGTSPITFLKQEHFTSGSQLITASNGSLYKQNGSSWDELTISGDFINGATATDAVYSSDILNGEMVISDNATDLWKYDGTTLAALGGSPDADYCKAIATYNNYLVLGNTYESSTRHAMRIRWSDIGDPEGWTAANFNTLQADAGDEILALRPAGQYLYVFCRRSIWFVEFVGSSAVTFVFRIVQPNFGVVGPRAIAEDGNIIYFASDDGIYAFHAQNPTGMQLISRRVDNTWKGRNESVNDLVTAMRNREYREIWFAFANGSATTNDRILTYNYDERQWGLYTGIAANAMAELEQTSGSIEPLFGDYNSEVMQANQTSSDNGTAINAFYFTKWFDFGDGFRHKRIKDVQLEAIGETDTSTIGVEYRYDFAQPPAEQVLSFDVKQSGAVYGTAVYGIDTYSGSGEPLIGTKPGVNRGRFAQFKISNSQDGSPFTVLGLTIRLILEE